MKYAHARVSTDGQSMTPNCASSRLPARVRCSARWRAARRPIAPNSAACSLSSRGTCLNTLAAIAAQGAGFRSLATHGQTARGPRPHLRRPRACQGAWREAWPHAEAHASPATRGDQATRQGLQPLSLAKCRRRRIARREVASVKHITHTSNSLMIALYLAYRLR
jgi:hypothetical protein